MRLRKHTAPRKSRKPAVTSTHEKPHSGFGILDWWSRSNSTSTSGAGRAVHGHTRGPTTTSSTTQRSSGQPWLRVTKNHTRTHTQPRSRPRPYTRRTTSSNRPYIYTASSYSSPLPLPTQQQRQHQRQAPRTLSSRCKHFLSSLRRKLHLLKFSFLLQVRRLRSWLSAKLGAQRYGQWLKNHKTQSRRAFVPSSYRDAQQQHEAKAKKSSVGGAGAGEEKTGRIRRLSQSTVKSLKKACSLNSERSELRQEDRRAMERLDELWRTREVHPVL